MTAPALVIDGIKFEETWSALEFYLPSDFEALNLRARFFPIQILHPRIYMGDSVVDLEPINVSDIGGEIKITKTEIEAVNGSSFQSGNLALLIPNALWYSIALFEAEMIHAAD